MTESFILQVHELLKILKQMDQDGMDFVKFLPLDEDYDDIDNEIIPASLFLSGLNTKNGQVVEYDDVVLVDGNF